MQRLILASSSPYRRSLLERLIEPFEQYSPDIDESPKPGETPTALALRLAEEKARALSDRYPDALIIGSDQVAALGEHTLGKPGSSERAIEQLSQSSGRRVDFHTGLALFNSQSGHMQSLVETVSVQFRPLNRGQIERYVEKEQPLDCAGSFKMEGLGISLFESIDSRDPNSLIGLPLMALVDMLAKEGIAIP